jgi:hypothetical protein
VGSNGLIQSAAVNAARFDHTSAGVCRGLLIEESRTNLLSRSEGLDANPWFPINTTTITSNNATAPDGATTAERFTVGATTQAYGVFNNATSWTSGVTYTTSFFCKADQITRVRIATGNPATHPVSAIFDLTGNGSIVGTPTGTASIERYANGWYRCSVTATSTATGLTSLRLTAVTGTTDNYPGNSVDSFLAWGAQNEVGSFATSYIPTTTGSVVRSADVCSYTDVSSFYNLAAGTLVGDLILYTPSPSANPELFRFGAANNRIQFGVTNVASEAIRPFIISGGTQTYSSTQGTTVAGTSRKVAIAFATNDAISCLNGTLGTQDTSVTMPVSISTAVIGVSSFTGHIAAIRYYKKRLSNAKLQALTA